MKIVKLKQLSFFFQEFQHISKNMLKLGSCKTQSSEWRSFNFHISSINPTAGKFCTETWQSEVFCKIGVPRNFVKFTAKHLCQSLFFNKVAGLRNWWKKRTWLRCFPVNFAKFLRAPFLQNTSRRLRFLYMLLTCFNHIQIISMTYCYPTFWSILEELIQYR